MYLQVLAVLFASKQMRNVWGCAFFWGGQMYVRACTAAPLGRTLALKEAIGAAPWMHLALKSRA